MRGFFHPFSSLLKAWTGSLCVCGLITLVVVRQESATLAQTWHTLARDWLPWAAVSPLLFRFVARLPLERPRWKLTLAGHVLCAILVLGLFTWWAEVVLPPTRTVAVTHADSQRAGDPHQRPARFPWLFAVLFFRLPVYLALVSVAHAIHFYRRYTERERTLSQAQLAALKMQLQPHFLFNTLNAITALIHLDPDAAEEMVVALSSLLRLSLETSDEQLLPLHREMEFVRRYLDIEHVRFGDRLCFALDMAPDTQAALVPAFLLQPLVENAVRHGLEPHLGKGLLKVSARRTGKKLRLTVSDNGVGLPEHTPLREGIGLANTRARLHVLFDGAASLELERGEGLTVHVTLPFHTSVA